MSDLPHSNLSLNLFLTWYARLPDTIAADSGSKPDDTSAYQQQAATQLSGFQTNYLGFQNALSSMNSDKGLANYDKNDNLETLLKNMVNANKDILSDTTTLVYNIPVLGPILGPSKHLYL